MDDVTALLEAALEHHQSGEFEQAESIYRHVLDLDPENGETHYLLGTVLLQLDRFEEAVPLLKKVVALRPDLADASNNLGIACDALGQTNEAILHFEAAIRARPDYEQARFNLAKLHIRSGNPAVAEQCFRDLAAIYPSHVSAWLSLASVCKVQGKLDEAVPCYQRVLELDPNDIDTRITFGLILHALRRSDEAIAEYEAVVAAKPDFVEIHGNLSLLYQEGGKTVEAIAAGERAVQLNPSYADGWNHLGLALRAAHRTDTAIEAFRKATSLESDFALAQFNLAATLLIVENYREGWTLYAKASESLDTSARHDGLPRWHGNAIEGQKLLVTADQGLGDTIQFARFLKAAKARSKATVVLECQPKLRELMAGCEGAEFVVELRDRPASVDFRIPLSALPAVLEIDKGSIGSPPYLRSSAAVPARLQPVLDTKELKVGLAWQGNPNNPRDFERSCPLAVLRPLFDVPGVRFIFLQEGDAGRRQLARTFPSGLPANVFDACAEPLDFPAMAALMSELDLVLTVDTSIAHLAGALGRPVWTMLCFTPDWRWQLDRADSPWYPTMRLFRQPRWGAWDAVVRDVAAALQPFERSAGRA